MDKLEDMTEETLIQAYNAGDVKEHRLSSVWEIRNDHFIRFGHDADINQQHKSARINYAMGLNVVATKVLKPRSNLCNNYFKNHPDLQSTSHLSILIMNKADGDILCDYTKQIDNEQAAELYKIITPPLVVGGALAAYSDPNRSNIIINNRKKATLIDYEYGLADYPEVNSAVYDFIDFTTSANHYPHFQTTLNYPDLIILADHFQDNFFSITGQDDYRDLREYRPLVQQRHKELVQYLKKQI